MIDEKKLMEWMRHNLIPTAEKAVLEALEKGLFKPDELQPPDFNPGESVTHIKFKYYGVGVVKKLSKSGKRAYVKFTWCGQVGYYDLSSLVKE